mmetsp:Transcript_21435/g.83137  ORF Transcript_21435/g.83137 Transcript_21435/m.83137 type:complete len:494 (-) Transcript_21435:26-1507(-)
MEVATWNVAAVNNNPFEYWITYDEDPNYTRLMDEFEQFVEAPGARDIAVGEIITDERFAALKAAMADAGWAGVDETEKLWQSEYKGRKIISEFLKDRSIGSKRLTSMPDRFTNTINVEGGQAYRPTVINQYEGKLDSLDDWFAQWKKFMFEEEVTIKGAQKKPCQLLQPIKKSKYPAISEEEEAISVPLQTVLLAAFDGVLVHMLNTLAPGTWGGIKAELTEKLNKRKVARTLEVLAGAYAGCAVIFLQEVAAAFVQQTAASPLGDKFAVVAPAKLDTRDQNSMLLLAKDRFADVKDVTAEAVEALGGAKVPLAAGDLLVVTCTDSAADGASCLFASFHGDTNGLATVPIVGAVHKLLREKYAGHRFLFGLDANTYETPASSSWLGVAEFAADFRAKGLTSCFGDEPDPCNYTTFNARTYLQPQLNKACKSSDKRKGADINPKDFILFDKAQFSCSKVWKDNTGEKTYVEGIVFPTITFPSDHGIVGAVLEQA